jgi:hypothetical protein
MLVHEHDGAGRRARESRHVVAGLVGLTVVAAGAHPASYVNLHPAPARSAIAAAGTRLQSQEGLTAEDMMHRLTLVLDRTDTLLAAAAPLAHSTFFADFGRTIARVDTLATAASRSAVRAGARRQRTRAVA